MADFRGCPYPILRNPRGFLHTETGLNLIKADLLCLLLTMPGERCMLPSFGCDLARLLFEPNDSFSADRAREMIANVIRTWEPRVVIEAIEVSVGNSVGDSSLDEDGSDDHVMSIKIRFFDPENINEVQALDLEIPLASS
jgi:uncharacterized protein